MSDSSSISSALAPGVALTSAVIYWANVQGRMDTISARVRGLNTELRAALGGTPRALSVMRQVEMLGYRTRVLHAAVIFAVVTLVGFLSSSAVLFVAPETFMARDTLAAALFIAGLLFFFVSLMLMLWEMLLARRSLDEDISSSKPQVPPR